MPRGGYRPGAGRPKGSRTLAKLLKVIGCDTHPVRLEAMARKAGLTPLAYMLVVMWDETQPPELRIRMAVAAAPFVHPKPGGEP